MIYRHFIALVFLITSTSWCLSSNTPSHSLTQELFAQASTLCQQEQFEQAINLYRFIISHQADNGTALFLLAYTFHMTKRPEAALVLYKELMRRYPGNLTIMHNSAYTLKKLNRVHEALDLYNQILAVNPNHVEAHFGRALSALLLGDFEQGWRDYEWRWQRANKKNPEHTYKKPRWDGITPLAGKTVLLTAEQGLGDTLQFIRYAQKLKQDGAKIILAAQKALVPLLSLCPYLDAVVATTDAELPSCDVVIPLMSLPLLCGTRITTVPCVLPYLYARTDLVQQWCTNLAHDHGYKVGICWQGNPQYSTQFLRQTVAEKSISLPLFAPLATIPGVSLYSLQQQTGTEQLHAIKDHFTLHLFDNTFDQEQGRFMDTAAVIVNLDLVITIDTSIAHLAGALGTPVWLLLPNPPDWRWMLEREDTPWYPNMRLFRQERPYDWTAVFRRITYELQHLVDMRGYTLAPH